MFEDFKFSEKQTRNYYEKADKYLGKLI